MVQAHSFGVFVLHLLIPSMASSDPTTSSLSNALTYPTHGSNNSNSTAGGSSGPTPAQSKDDKRIYVGNLDPAIDEYMVLKLFSPFGKITKLDFMFHWHGPKKGTPRGYCFLEFESAAQAAAAVSQMNRKAIKMRPLSVSLANMAPPSTDSEKGRKRTLDPSRPTAFSLLKAGALKNATTNEKIKAMERKLAQMAEPPKVPAPPVHASLPLKPATTIPPASSSSSGRYTKRGPSSGTGTGRGAHRGGAHPGADTSSTTTRHRPY